MHFKISKVLAKDLLQKESRFIKDGQLIFNRVIIRSHKAHDCNVELYYNSCCLAVITADGCPGPYMTFDLQLNDSNMKLSFEDKDVCNPPEFTILEKAKEAITKAMKELETL